MSLPHVTEINLGVAAGLAGTGIISSSAVSGFPRGLGLTYILARDWSSSNNIILTKRSHLDRGLESGLK